MNKDELEYIAKIKFRRGFDKFIDNAINHFNFKELDESNAQTIINFINASNSRLSESYWILRTNYNKDEYTPLMEIYKTDFINSSYTNSNRRSVNRKFIEKYNSRGYSGYINIRGNDLFIRSSHEFIYLHYFDKIIDSNFRISCEDKIFYYKDYAYKPDVFVYDNNNSLIEIIEIKSNEFKMDDKYELFIKYFKKIKIKFTIFSNSNDILKQHPDINQRLKKWKQEYITTHDNMVGKNNPMYGLKHSEKTKKLISEKAKERCSIDVYRKNQSRVMKLAYASNEQYRINHKKMCIDREAKKREKLKNNYSLNPIHCHICSNIIDYESKHRKTCSTECCRILTHIKKKEKYANKKY